MIKRIALLLTALTLALTLSLGMLATADGVGAKVEEPKNAAQLCKLILGKGFFIGVADVSQGACVALVTTRNATPFFADLCQREEFREEVAFFTGKESVNQGQCVQVLKAEVR